MSLNFSVIIILKNMRTAFLLTLVVVLVLAEDPAGTITGPLTCDAFEEGALDDSEGFIKNIQGAVEHVFFVVFKKDSKEYAPDLIAALVQADNDGQLDATYDIYQAEWKHDWNCKVGEIDARDQKKYNEALKLIGASEDDFDMTFPLLLMSKGGDAYLASMQEYTETVKKSDGETDTQGLPAPILKKFLKLTKAKKTR